jgi:hypothetical protein
MQLNLLRNVLEVNPFVGVIRHLNGPLDWFLYLECLGDLIEGKEEKMSAFKIAATQVLLRTVKERTDKRADERQVKN